MTHTIYAELLDQCRAMQFSTHSLPLSGSLVEVPGENDLTYYYLQKSRRVAGGKQPREFIGSSSYKKVLERVKSFTSDKAIYKSREELVSALKKNGVTAPTAKLANLLLTLHDEGVLARSVLVGTLAFQAYGPMLGVKFGQSAFYTQDVDLAKADSVELAMPEKPIEKELLDVLKEFDETFDGIMGFDRKQPPVSYMNKDGLRVDVLFSFSGPERKKPIRASKIQSHAHPQRYLEFLVEAPTEAVLLIGGGLMCHIPAPARFALHKLIVSEKRNSSEAARAYKDREQASCLIELLIEEDPESLEEAYENLKARGPKWRANFRKGLEKTRREDFLEFFQE
jgi:hypothetical protein